MKEKRYVYDSGTPFTTSLREEFLEPLRRRLVRKAACFVIDGASGEGKTTLAVHLAEDFEGKPLSLDPKFHPQIALGGKNFLLNALVCHEQKHKVMVYDEAGDFNKHATMTKFNRVLNEFFEKYRFMKLLIIICVPCFNDLDSGLFDKQLVRGLIHCHDGTDNQTDYTVFDMDEIGYIRKTMKDWPHHRPKAYWYVEYFAKGHFLDLPPERSRALATLSGTDKLESIRGKAIKQRTLLSYSEIAEQLNTTYRWVSTTLKSLGIEAEDIEGRVLLFNKNVVGKLKARRRTTRRKLNLKKK